MYHSPGFNTVWALAKQSAASVGTSRAVAHPVVDADAEHAEVQTREFG